MKFLSIIGCFIALLLGSVAAQDPMVRVHLETSDEVWVGQKVTLVVELLVPGFFAGSPAFELPRIPGVLVIPPMGSPVVSTEEIKGTSYTVQRHELAVFAQRAGPHEIPAFAVRFGYKRAPLDKEALPLVLKTTAVSFTAKLPPGAEKLGTVLSARDLKVEEKWQPEPDKVKPKAGDAFTRTITFSAPEVPGMAFPPFSTPEMDGLGIYPQEPVVEDHTNRGTMTGQRCETIRYTCKRPGHFTIPPARLTWWDLDAKQLRTIDFPARTFEVIPNPDLASASAAADTAKASSSIGQVLLWVVGIMLLLVIGLHFGLPRLVPVGKRIAAFFRPVHLQPLNPPSAAENP